MAGRARKPHCDWSAGGGNACRPAAPQARRPLVLVDRTQPQQSRLGFAEVGPDREVWEYAGLVTSLDDEILTLGQLYRDRGDRENTFDELNNHWGWGGFTPHDLQRCRLLAGSVALIFNWWSLFVRLADQIGRASCREGV